MKKESTILVPFDFSESSKIALDYAVSLIALDTNIKKSLVYITTNDDKKTSYESYERIKLEYVQDAFIADTDSVVGFNFDKERDAIDMVAILPRNQAKDNGQSGGKLTKTLAMNSQLPLFVID
ncbi:hypothetical protein [uncultured Croceitalea sp.]|uniref:hypothetical protein n=1 Tax=uncultured Croceitalea sp. TaxID=1798908 RepID=UPI00374FB0F3